MFSLVSAPVPLALGLLWPLLALSFPSYAVSGVEVFQPGRWGLSAVMLLLIVGAFFVGGLLVGMLLGGLWQRRRDQRQLRLLGEQQQRLAMTLRNAGLGYWEWHLESDTVVVDERAAELLGKEDGGGCLYLDPAQAHREEPPWRPLFEAIREDLDSGVVKAERHIKYNGNDCWLLLKGCAPNTAHSCAEEAGQKENAQQESGPLYRRNSVLCGSLADVSALHSYQEKLLKLSITDPLTGLLSRRYFLDCLTRSCAQTQRDGGVMSLVLLNIDHFKQINEAYGYPAGDAVLQQFADHLKHECRPYDLLGRFANHTLVLLFCGIDKYQAQSVLQRFEQRLRTLQLLAGSQRMYCSFSGGACDSSEIATAELSVCTLIQLADSRLQWAKQQGLHGINAERAA